MIKNITIFVYVVTSFSFCFAQSNDKLPYYEVPEYSKTYTAGTMAARMVDALGFRFYWASEGLTEKDLVYKLNDDGRSTAETIDHIYDLSKVILNSTLNRPNSRDEEADMSYTQVRTKTLNNLKQAADILRVSNDISKFKIIFGEQKTPFWNNVNGPIADAIWHCGQIAVYRRATGNSINSKVNHFTGKVRN